jgi:hypothetical protein
MSDPQLESSTKPIAKKPPNSRLLTDALGLQLRRAHRAAKLGRYAALDAASHCSVEFQHRGLPI